MRTTTGPALTSTEIWRLREDGRMTEAFEAWLDFCVSYGLSSESTTAEAFDRLIPFGLSADASVEFLLLRPAFMREPHRRTETKRLLHELQTVLAGRQVEPGYRFYFQSGISARENGHHDRALDHFLTARRMARGQRENQMAFLNLILCMEELEIETGSFQDEFGSTLRELALEPWAQPFRNQLQALQARAFYRRGDLERLDRLLSEVEPSGSVSYRLAWLSRLPLFRFAEGRRYEALPGSISPDSISVAQDSCLRADYQRRTLNGLLIEDDLVDNVPLLDRIERLYLWVWHWMVDPQSERLHKILHLKTDLDRALGEAVNQSEFLLLENSLRWLGLFAGSSDRELRDSLRACKPAIAESNPVLDYERRFLDLLMASRDGRGTIAKDTADVLRTHTAAGRAHFRLPHLLAAVINGERAPDGLETLCESLRVIAHPKEADAELGENLQAGLLPHMRQLACAIAAPSAPSPQPEPSESLSRSWLNREDFERLLGVSKATAVRKLGRWQKDNLLLKRGNGKASQYKITPALEKALLRDSVQAEN